MDFNLNNNDNIDELTTNITIIGRTKLSRYLSLYLLIFLLSIAALYTICSHGYCHDNSSLIGQNDCKINPNLANWSSLARLPGIGRGKAEEIIRFRQKFIFANNKNAFEKPRDLAQVSGIGLKTVEKLKGYLKFD